VEQVNSTLLHDLIQHEAWSEISGLCAQMHVQDIAEALEDLPPETMARALEEISRDSWSDIFSYLPEHEQNPLLQYLDDDSGRFIISGLSPDDRTALLESLPASEVEKLLKLLTPAEIKRALKQLGYPEDSAGQSMNPNYVRVERDDTTAVAIAAVRRSKLSDEHLTAVFVTDKQRRYQGLVTLASLVQAPPETAIGDLIQDEDLRVRATDDRMTAARILQARDLSMMPVVDSEDRLVGVITFDDAMEDDPVVEPFPGEEDEVVDRVGALRRVQRAADVASVGPDRRLVALVEVD
jgi:magnesium transporter